MREIHTGEKTFSEVLCDHISKQGRKNSELYKRACITRSLYHDMSKKDYRPSFENALRIALALNLNYEETVNLLSRARLTFSPSFMLDKIIVEFLENPVYRNPGEYNLPKVDELLDDKGVEVLFSLKEDSDHFCSLIDDTMT